MKYHTWDEVINLSKNYKKIVVSGCQRSGTTIMAKAIAHEIKYIHHDESDFGVDNELRFSKIIENDENSVIQAPALLHILPKYVNDNVLIVIIERNPVDVIKSMIRVNWFKHHGRREYRKYKSEPINQPIELYNTKLEFANTFNNIRINYEEIKNSDLYVEKRDNWGTKRTR